MSPQGFARLYAFALAIDLGLEFVVTTSATSPAATGAKVLVAKALYSEAYVEAPRPTSITDQVILSP
ncbi:hypothetical protein DFP72DRAFT_1075511 [Ephemerocybe angulata]|uniref:Uncharacterized protein n=1 Tax=Ephemerocybe angulata TaxID=980116 RepID=A0A8H6HJC1_9AGAR|nr:hypothetical protein DFP72DRAFT_1075511 [Tulosesus angulatus]